MRYEDNRQDGKNCIVLPYDRDASVHGEVSWYKYRGAPDKEACISKLNNYLKSPDLLYGIYHNSMANAENYKMANYYSKYMGKTILEEYGRN